MNGNWHIPPVSVVQFTHGTAVVGSSVVVVVVDVDIGASVDWEIPGPC